MSIQVNVTREETSAYFTQVLEALTNNKHWKFTAKFTENQMEELEEAVKKGLDSRKYKDAGAALTYIEEQVFGKIKVRPGKVVQFSLDGLEEMPEVISSFAQTLWQLTELEKYQPSQQVLTEE